MRTKRAHIYELVYIGLGLFGKRGKRCREVFEDRGRILIEFEDRRRDWCFRSQVKHYNDITAKEALDLAM